MKLFIKKAVAFILLLGLILLFSGMFLSCASSKKHKEKSKIETTIDTKKDSVSTTTIDATTKTTEQNKVNEQFAEECLAVEVAEGEELEIINFDANGNKTGSTKYKGSGKLKKSKVNKTTATSNDKETVATTNTNSKTELLERIKQSKQEKSTVVDKETKGLSLWIYFYWIIFIIIAIALLYLNKRFNVIGWLIDLIKK
jgi:hypothetical protein